MNYDKSKYRKIDWKHFMMLHWIINPGLLINELILGQRVPKIMLTERSKEKSWVERNKIPCPSCNAIHEGSTWSLQNKTAFKNWFGLYCPNCGGVIPCLMNISTFLILAITSPIWFWFRKSLYKQWLAKQPERYKNVNTNTPTYDSKSWWKTGLGWGMFMFVATTTMEWAGGEPILIKKLFVGFVIWIIGGLVFGFAMEGIMGNLIPKKRKEQ